VRTHNYRFGLVLGLILISLAFGLAAPSGDGARLVTVALQGMTLVAAVIASGAHPAVERFAIGATIVLFFAAAGAVIGTDQVGSDSARLISVVLIALAPAAIITGVIREYRDRGVFTVHTMFGGLCLYLLLGIFFANALEAVQSLVNQQMLSPASDATADFLYFSFVSLTTTGFGDVVAATSLGRSFAITEALVGQIYLVTVVALIVSNLRPATRTRVKASR
jgi:hypothetical protein